MTERVTRRLTIHGLVQGVWFRESMRQEAARLGVTGWVRNRADGTVEAMVQGNAPSVEAITRWARQGPEQARVERVESAPGEGDYAAFEKRPTA
jgi:acylphosphatase